MPESTLSAVSLAPKDAIAFLRQKTNITSEHWTDLWQEAHSRAFTVAGATTEALVEDFRREVAKALEDGTSLAEFRAGFDAIVTKHGWTHTGTPGWRADIIYQTNLSTAYSAGRYRQMTDPDVLEAFPYWRYQHNPAQHPRQQHLDWDGITLRADDGWWRSHWPPNGWRCHCSVEPTSDHDLQRAGKDGPDRAPPLDLRDWRNPKTGETIQVPRGIDPGFGYNPGQAWLDGEAGARVSQGEPAARRPTLRAESVEPAPAPVRPASQPVPEPEPIAPDARSWIDAQLDGRRRDGTARVIGNIPPRALDRLAEVGELPPTAAITLTSRGLQHLARDAKAARGGALSAADVQALPRLLASPRAVLRDRRTGRLLLVFDTPDQAERRLGKVVVQLAIATRRRSADRRSTELANTVATAGLVDAHQLRRDDQYEVLSGDV